MRSRAPHLFPDLATRDYRAVLPHEQREDLERLWRQGDTLTVPEKLGRVGVELEGSETQHGLGRSAYSATIMERSWRAQCPEKPDTHTIVAAPRHG